MGRAGILRCLNGRGPSLYTARITPTGVKYVIFGGFWHGIILAFDLGGEVQRKNGNIQNRHRRQAVDRRVHP